MRKFQNYPKRIKPRILPSLSDYEFDYHELASIVLRQRLIRYSNIKALNTKSDGGATSSGARTGAHGPEATAEGSVGRRNTDASPGSAAGPAQHTT